MTTNKEIIETKNLKELLLYSIDLKDSNGLNTLEDFLRDIKIYENGIKYKSILDMYLYQFKTNYKQSKLYKNEYLVKKIQEIEKKEQDDINIFKIQKLHEIIASNNSNKMIRKKNYDENRDEILKEKKELYKKNSELMKEYSKKQYEIHKTTTKKRQKEYFILHNEEIKAKANDRYQKKTDEEKKKLSDSKIDYRKEYYDKNKLKTKFKASMKYCMKKINDYEEQLNNEFNIELFKTYKAYIEKNNEKNEPHIKDYDFLKVFIINEDLLKQSENKEPIKKTTIKIKKSTIETPIEEVIEEVIEAPIEEVIEEEIKEPIKTIKIKDDDNIKKIKDLIVIKNQIQEVKTSNRTKDQKKNLDSVRKSAKRMIDKIEDEKIKTEMMTLYKSK